MSADGVYTFTLMSDGGFASIYIFEESIALVNCVMGANVDPVSEVATLTAGVQYLAVPFDDTFIQLGGNYTLEISGPGEITEPYSGPVLDELGNLVYPCDYPMPTTAVLYDVPQGAPAFFDADLSTQVNFNLPAGQWKVMEFSGDFARVWITCGGSPVWIPTNALGVALE